MCLSLDENKITKIEGLNNLKNLERLYFSNRITKISAELFNFHLIDEILENVSQKVKEDFQNNIKRMSRVRTLKYLTLGTIFGNNINKGELKNFPLLFFHDFESKELRK